MTGSHTGRGRVSRVGTGAARRALADAAPVPFWLDGPERPDPLRRNLWLRTLDHLGLGFDS